MSIPTDLGTADVGLLLQVADYGHLMRWSGTVWEFAPGDSGNGYIKDCLVPPQQEGWALCDGQGTSYLRSGNATLFATSITTPNELSTGVYHKSGATPTIGVQAAVAATISGSVATEAAHTHGVTVPAQSSADESAHTHAVDPPNTTSDGGWPFTTVDQNLDATTIDVSSYPHTHDTNIAPFTSGAGSAHHHTVGAQSVTSGGGSAHGHTVGSLVNNLAAEPPHITVLRYFRR